MGHVPPRPFPREGASSHFPRRKRREAGEDGAQALSTRRARTGAAGERLAAIWLRQRGLQILGTNVQVADAHTRGELDLIALDGESRVAVEVRTVVTRRDPIDAVDAAKRRRVRRLAHIAGADRVDFIALRFGGDALEVHWVPG